MAPTLRFLKPQEFLGIDYQVGSLARVPHEITTKMAARWVEAGIAEWVTGAEIRESKARRMSAEQQARARKVEADARKAAAEAGRAAAVNDVLAEAARSKSEERRKRK